jgi:carbon monoxide dehydrogenase subunit G
MPGATLTEVAASAFSGTVKVKLGPISLLYKGSGEFLETDEQARRVVIKASGKDARGNGTAAATVTVSLRADGDGTAGSVHTDLSITGKPAQFGRGMISEVGGKILDAFATCLASKLAPVRAEAPGPVPVPAVEAPDDAPGEARTERRPQLTVVEEPERATSNGTPEATPEPAATRPETEPVDLLAYAGPSVLKRAAPLIAALIAVLAIVALRRRSR